MWTWQYIPAGLLAVLALCYIVVMVREPKIRGYKPYILLTAILFAILVLAGILSYGYGQ